MKLVADDTLFTSLSDATRQDRVTSDWTMCLTALSQAALLIIGSIIDKLGHLLR